MTIHYCYDCLLLASAVDPDERRDDCLIVSNRHSNQETKQGFGDCKEKFRRRLKDQLLPHNK